MPYQEHSSAGELPSSDKVIWRFMSLAKFLDLMRTSSLYFSRLDILRKLDPFEGTFTRPIREAFERLASDEVAVRAFLQLGNDEPIKPYMMSQFQPDNWRRAQDRVFLDTYVNCWHLSEEESASLWSVYASQVDGVAVKTTVGGLVKSLEATDQSILVGRVEYIDYLRDAISITNALNPVFRKRTSFASDKELRACFMNVKRGRTEDVPIGIHVRCDMAQLIQEVRVSPLVQAWHVDVVRDATRAFGEDFPVRRSEISDPAVF